jgi:hypothetical protein
LFFRKNILIQNNYEEKKGYKLYKKIKFLNYNISLLKYNNKLIIDLKIFFCKKLDFIIKEK